MSAQETEIEQGVIHPSYEEWFEAQVRAIMPHWVQGSWRYGYQDGHVYWPMHGSPLASRLTHLASLRAHS